MEIVRRILISYSNSQGPLCKDDFAGAFPWMWADLGWFQPNTILIFLFSFSTRLGKFIRNYRKMIKI
jgi:hypothetical protein